MSPHAATYRASWVFPGWGEPVSDGVVEVADGKIVDVRPARGEQALDLGRCALIPGLVNAHTHLEFSSLTTPLEPLDNFAGWVRRVVGSRRERKQPVDEVIRSGLQEVLRCGTTTLGEIASCEMDVWNRVLDAVQSPQNDSSQHARPVTRIVDVVVFRELIGLFDEAVEQQLDAAASHLQQAPAAGIHLGLSPHAPYSVHPRLLDKLVELAAANNVPLAMHIAETRAELELLGGGTGPLAQMLHDFGVWREGLFQKRMRPLDYLQRLAAAPYGLVVHGNYLDDEEIEFLARHPHLSVVYCPRTHAAMGHAPHPWRRMRERGVNVAIGTDSRASNPDLSLFDELRFLKGRNPDLTSSELVELATLSGARALGLDQQVGSLQPGRAANIVAVSLPQVTPLGGNEAEALFSPAARIVGVMLRGEWVDGKPGWP